MGEELFDELVEVTKKHNEDRICHYCGADAIPRPNKKVRNRRVDETQYNRHHHYICRNGHEFDWVTAKVDSNEIRRVR